jgi:hypothetical protein
MSLTPVAIVTDAYCQTHQRILNLAEKLSEEQLHWRYTPTGHSIAFHLWHVARWADHLQAAIPGMTPELDHRLGPRPQLWEANDLAVRWGFDPDQLGYGATGMTMPDEVAANLPFPSKSELLAYLRQVFVAAEQAVKAIDEREFQAAEQPQPLTEGIWGESVVGDAVVTHLTHTNRHLGMIECLAGLQTGAGTATV